MWKDQHGLIVPEGQDYIAANGVLYPAAFPRAEIPGLVFEQDDPATTLAFAKAAKNQQINSWRSAANKTHFIHADKQIACDDLSRSDIDAVANSIALTGLFPAGFPGAWKAMDNSYIPLPSVDDFKAMHASMTAQGTANFARSQALKAALVAATTVAEVDAIQW